jgi:hypothetical protein
MRVGWGMSFQKETFFYYFSTFYPGACETHGKSQGLLIFHDQRIDIVFSCAIEWAIVTKVWKAVQVENDQTLCSYLRSRGPPSLNLISVQYLPFSLEITQSEVLDGNHSWAGSCVPPSNAHGSSKRVQLKIRSFTAAALFRLPLQELKLPQPEERRARARAMSG